MTPLDRIRDFALTLPGTEERPKDGQSAFFVEDAPFVQVREAVSGGGQSVVCVRTSDENEQAMLLETAPDTYSRADDLGSSGWIGVTLAGEPDWQLVEDRIARSWELAAPDRLLEAGGR